MSGDTKAAVLERARGQVRQAVGGDRFELFALPGAAEASKVSPSDAPPFLLINRTVREVFPGTVVVPGLMVAATDSIHFAELSDHIYRFMPVMAKAADVTRFHGTDERISVANYADLIRFYHSLISQGARL